MTEKMEEVVVELHGNVHIAVFDIVHTESGRKARGGELRAMYVEGEEEVTCPRTKEKVMKRMAEWLTLMERLVNGLIMGEMICSTWN